MEIRGQIKSRLTADLFPSLLIVIDESEKHKGHAGQIGESGHFAVKIVSERFNELSLLERHRLIYNSLEAFGKQIHALKIQALTPEEQLRATQKEQ